ncbi:MAG TPA: T9SS type A sorting domain-containing protein [Chitinophagaceae bacterium]|nr:T9SS type A sorting domain-containing protein [Chitinophagaceae bacterium]
MIAKGVNNKIIRVEIFTIEGRRVMDITERGRSNQYSQLINGEGLTSGVFLMKIYIEKKVFSARIIIAR